MSQICQQCHAEVSESVQAAQGTVCPACGGALATTAGADLNSPGTPPRQVDHRGILLPRRHAVGGVITPR